MTRIPSRAGTILAPVAGRVAIAMSPPIDEAAAKTAATNTPNLGVVALSVTSRGPTIGAAATIPQLAIAMLPVSKLGVNPTRAVAAMTSEGGIPGTARVVTLEGVSIIAVSGTVATARSRIRRRTATR